MRAAVAGTILVILSVNVPAAIDAIDTYGMPAVTIVPVYSISEIVTFEFDVT